MGLSARGTDWLRQRQARAHGGADAVPKISLVPTEDIALSRPASRGTVPSSRVGLNKFGYDRSSVCATAPGPGATYLSTVRHTTALGGPARSTGGAVANVTEEEAALEVQEQELRLALYDRLMRWRMHMAGKRSISAFNVLPTQALVLIAKHRPTTVADLAGLDFVRLAAAERYGPDILGLVSRCVQEHSHGGASGGPAPVVAGNTHSPSSPAATPGTTSQWFTTSASPAATIGHPGTTAGGPPPTSRQASLPEPRAVPRARVLPPTLRRSQTAPPSRAHTVPSSGAHTPAAPKRRLPPSIVGAAKRKL